MSGEVTTAERKDPNVADNRRDDGPTALGRGRLARVACDLAKLRMKEYLEFDSAAVRTGVGVTGLAAGLGLFAAGYTQRGFDILSKLHRSACPDWVARRVERVVRDAARPGQPDTHPLRRVYAEYVEGSAPSAATEKFFMDPGRLLGSLVLVLKSPGPNERGVLLIKYSHVFPLFAKLFDVEAIAKRYYLVLEPSWCGYCSLDVLCYSRYRFPVFVQAHEPRDAAFIKAIDSNLVPIPTSPSSWVDHRVFKPDPDVQKDIDVLMIASWADFKRHHRFFTVLRRLKDSGLRPRVALLGYPAGRTQETIQERAAVAGVDDLLEIREWVPPEEVGRFLNRAKVNVVWSRREGGNRAVIEGMFAGVPCVMRVGHNYGHHYPFINSQTGCFSSENALPDVLRRMIASHTQFAPRDWTMANVSCQNATAVMGEVIRKVAAREGEAWTQPLAVKVNRLHTMAYWDETDNGRFREDYAHLRSVIVGSI